jgi:tellurite resistance protein
VARKKHSSLWGWIIGGAFILALLREAPVIFWICIISAVAYFIYKHSKSSATRDSSISAKPAKPNTQALSITRQTSDTPIPPKNPSQSSHNISAAHVASVPARAQNVEAIPVTRQAPDSPISVPPTSATKSPEQPSFRIPTPPKNSGVAARWVPLGESIEIAGFNITGGMLYFGSKLADSYGSTEPALIDPSKPVSRASGDFTERLTDYWPSYSDISPEARRAYLRWLAEGRNHPEANIGYVFLYFYGLERRALLDATTDKAAEADGPHIIAELKRLLGIYGSKSGSFRNYASNLLQLLELSFFAEKLYEKPIPELAESFELPYYLRLALGQSAIDGVPIPSHIALAWAEHDPGVFKRTPVHRCKSEFRQLFTLKYQQQYGDGIKLSANRTKLKLVYRPASSGFRGSEVKMTFGETPDVTALTSPIKKLRALVDACTDELDAYSRYLGRNPDKRDTLEGALQLPVSLWSEPLRKTLDSFKASVADSMVVMTFSDIAAAFKGTDNLNKEKIQGFVRALESANICMEPDVLAGAKSPKPEDKVILFHSEPSTLESRTTPAYKAALVTLELAAGVAAADGEFSASELRLLNTNIDSWVHLPSFSQKRLKARTRLLMAAPVSLASLKKKIEPLNLDTREAVASYLATLVQADGVISPDEVKFLEKTYKLLGVDTKKMYSEIHVAATTGAPSVAKSSPQTAGFKLDTARIAALQQDTEKVSALLAGIFVEDEPPTLQLQSDETEESNTDSTILSLDEPHSAFARMLLSRPSWLRSELSDVALDLDVMLDGALERINEAALDALDIPFTEGDDPIEINPEIIEKINQ